jgi:hypothetical protein
MRPVYYYVICNESNDENSNEMKRKWREMIINVTMILIMLYPNVSCNLKENMSLFYW